MEELLGLKWAFADVLRREFQTISCLQAPGSEASGSPVVAAKGDGQDREFDADAYRPSAAEV